MAKRSTLESVYRTYMPDVYRYLRSLCGDDATAEDLVQETFYRAYLHLENYRDEQVKPWLFRVAYHALIDLKRKGAGASRLRTSGFIACRTTTGMGRNRCFCAKRGMTGCWHGLGGLPEMQKQAVVLVDLHQFSYQEGAEVMGITLSHFKVVLFRARQQLRKIREKEERDERRF
ncbi:sigma-70 family RNA polymerase sigma factor [Paenibacillus sp. JTLBN-2024]